MQSNVTASRNQALIILDLCGGTGTWSKPYLDAGYDVRLVTLPKYNVNSYRPPHHVHGVLAAPPCTHLCRAGARYWKEWGPAALKFALQLVYSCLFIISITKPNFWVIENPIGRLWSFLGRPQMTFHPYMYGDPYTKRTCLWGRFKPPWKNVTPPTLGSKMHRLPNTPQRSMLRSITPPGFARAFFEANQ